MHGLRRDLPQAAIGPLIESRAIAVEVQQLNRSGLRETELDLEVIGGTRLDAGRRRSVRRAVIRASGNFSFMPGRAGRSLRLCGDLGQALQQGCEATLTSFRLEIRLCRPASELSLFDDDDGLFDAPSCGVPAEESAGVLGDAPWLPAAPAPGGIKTPDTADSTVSAKVSVSVSDSGELPEADAAPDAVPDCAPLDPELDGFKPPSTCAKSAPLESAASDSPVRAPTVDANTSAAAVTGADVVVRLP